MTELVEEIQVVAVVGDAHGARIRAAEQWSSEKCSSYRAPGRTRCIEPIGWGGRVVHGTEAVGDVGGS